jgi:MinD-like ATPase involved in chromosome partitioning or flagellar assembly
MHLDPNLNKYDMLLLFKREIKNKIRKRIERLLNDYLFIDYTDYTAFTNK